MDTADIKWWYDNIASNTTISPTFPGIFVNAKTPCKLDVKDAQTFTFTFTNPNGFFLWDLARPDGDICIAPAHYL